MAILKVLLEEPWDLPPFPERGNVSERVLFESIGRALMQWEEVEGEFAHLFSAFATGTRFDTKANKDYGVPNVFSQRMAGLDRSKCRYFIRRPDQKKEGEFAEIARLANGYSLRRNDIAHGRARPIHWILNPNSPKTLLSLAPKIQWCVIPAHFNAKRFTAANIPAYVLTSREINHFAEAFRALARRASTFAYRIEAQARA